MRIMMICYVLGYILLLHQTTTVFAIGPAYTSWVISFFYIKPQRHSCCRQYSCVGLYPSSTSNHNTTMSAQLSSVVGLYPSSTSNHNQSFPLNFSDLVGLYPSSTSNHNSTAFCRSQGVVGLYPSSTSNHNELHAAPTC